ncbi:amidohydrolase [Micrococcus sp.]|uniref:amidohydrolase n=1 Tax=Micrococcus sp. TaxID=1271 RepID=UPI002A90ED63|nr:amidohydrolase [Micrococcus sp.]MDY6056081.1 amidohydrolase [Micrococcus sp.]
MTDVRTAPTPLPESLRLDEELTQTLHEEYVHLHRNPELSMQEHRTAEWIEARLDELGIGHERVAGTGVVGVLRHPEGVAGPTVAYRADSDGLPVQEDSGLEYASTARGTLPDGTEVPVMHACGHDTHVAMGLSAARVLARHPEAWGGTVVFVFQPGEETAAGAQAMLDDGLWDRVPRPEAVIGQHVMPAKAGTVHYAPGDAMCLADSFKVTFTGKGAHGSMPERSIDPILLAAHAVTRLQGIVAREVAPADRAVVTVGTFHAGVKENVIPDTAEIALNVRTPTPEVREKVTAAIHRVLAAEALASGAPEPAVERYNSFPRMHNDAELTPAVMASIAATLGEDAVQQMAPLMGSEDVGALADALGVPLVYWFLGGFAGESFADNPANHTPQFAPLMEPTLTAGVHAALAGLLHFVGR